MSIFLLACVLAVAWCPARHGEQKLRQLGFLVAVLALSGCASSPSYTIHNPDIYATAQPLVDDDGIPLALPTTSQHWTHGNSRMAD